MCRRMQVFKGILACQNTGEFRSRERVIMNKNLDDCSVSK